MYPVKYYPGGTNVTIRQLVTNGAGFSFSAPTTINFAQAVEHVYVVGPSNDSSAIIQFGDGIQGARLPASGTYAIAVFSPIGDVDPTLGTGDYRLELSRCTNTGANLDGDLLVDACDDDDDGDTFKDAEDAAPTDALACQDIEDDGCDDCSGGAFEPFDDGLDSDNDALCDSGDLDDDNDGCDDADDPAPQTPSVDDDLDFVGLDCDNCPDHANHDQLDGDGDGTGDVCEVPEPGTLMQGTLALVVLAGIARRRQRSMTGTPSTALE